MNTRENILREKANLAIELYKEYYKDNKEIYNILCQYSEKKHLEILDDDYLFGGISIIIDTDDIILEVRYADIYKIYVKEPTNNIICVERFDEVLNKCVEENNSSWDYTIEYLQKVLNKNDN